VDETTALLAGIVKRVEAAGLDPKLALRILAVDDCCKVRAKIMAILPHIKVMLDLWHWQARILERLSVATPNYSNLAGRAVEAITAAHEPGKPRLFKPRDQQVAGLQVVLAWAQANVPNFDPLTLQNQIKHCEKGCFERPDGTDDLPTDTGKNENVHRFWNMVQQGIPSGLVGFDRLSHDFVHRRNVRISFNQRLSPLCLEGGGSHHLFLVNQVLDQRLKLHGEQELARRRSAHGGVDPSELKLVDNDSGEHFGLGVAM
jgi:hypothetical protein